MSEKQKISPEANSQRLDDLYQQAADCLETWLHYGEAKVKPSELNPHLLAVQVTMPEFNGKSLVLDYERPAQEDDPTQVDRTYPLIWDDDEGKNIWCTWIGIKTYDTDGKLLHDVDIMHSSNDVNGVSRPANAYDKQLQPGQDPEGELATVSMLDAGDLEAHMEWAVEELLERHPVED